MEDRLDRIGEGEALDRYIARGQHHMRWKLGGPRLGHFEMLSRFVERYPVARRIVREVSSVPFNVIADEICRVTELANGTEFTRNRSRFVLELTNCRHQLLGAHLLG